MNRNIDAFQPNTLVRTDGYKLNHMRMYHPGVTKVTSYLEARVEGMKTVFFGLQYYLMKYLCEPITKNNVTRWYNIYEHALGYVPEDSYRNIKAVQELGYWPLEIHAIPEGTYLDSQNALMTIRSTDQKVPLPWAVGYLESLLLKIWNTCTVATHSVDYRKMAEKYARLTCDDDRHVPYAVVDFGYRGVSSEETAELSGSAHLLSFLGSDTLSAINMVWDYYAPTSPDTIIGKTVPATEHSVMCSYSRENEFEAIDHIIFNVVPEGIVSVVSDTFDLWAILTDYVQSRKDKILARNGTVVFRPDSGNPVDIICGTYRLKHLPEQASPAEKGALRLLWDTFGGTINDKGYQVLNPKVGLIYGDGMFMERYENMMYRMMVIGFASSNIVIGVGGLLLQQHNRDEHKYAMKAIHVVRDGEGVEIYKDPITDPTKKSKKGFLNVTFDGKIYKTIDQCESPYSAPLVPVFKDGNILKLYSLEDVRGNLTESLKYGVEDTCFYES